MYRQEPEKGKISSKPFGDSRIKQLLFPLEKRFQQNSIDDNL